MSDEPKNGSRETLKRLRQVVTLGALAVALGHVIWPHLAIDSITLLLLVIALVPWLAPIFKSLEFPGGWKIEFQELQKASSKADAAGLLAPPQPMSPDAAFTFERVADQDPNLALAGLRIEIEKRLVALAQKRGLEPRGRGVRSLLNLLNQQGVLDQEASSALADLTGLLNSAVHGASVERNAASWAFDIGPRLLARLDELGAEA